MHSYRGDRVALVVESNGLHLLVEVVLGYVLLIQTLVGGLGLQNSMFGAQSITILVQGVVTSVSLGL